MNAAVDSVKKAPEGLAAPKYGALELEGKTWSFILDEPEGKPARLFIDANGDGDLTNDAPVEWKARTSDGLTMHDGKAQVDLGNGKLGGVNLYRFDPKDPRREAYKNLILYYTDYGLELTFDLDGKPFTTFISGQPRANARLWIDRDGNKQQSMSKETVIVGKAFNFTGTTYVLALQDGAFALEKSAEALPVAPLPPNLVVGQKALPFVMDTTDRKSIAFPKTYAGKLVMLDFWATWCGPCIAELPNVKKAYADWHDKGFEVLGISFDSENMTDKLAAFTKENEMPWPQIYEGKGWNTTLGEQYDVSGIPFVLLVDGDSGEILATARELRGPGLSEFIGKALAKKKGQ
jgi:thiol-disulfide isomerase/thioredoxin